MYYNNQQFNPFGAAANAVPNMNQGIKVNPWLKEDELKMLQKADTGFSLQVSQEEISRGICNHRNSNGELALHANENGTCTCSICGETLSPMTDGDQVAIEDATTLIINILQSIKLMYMSMPANVGRDYFQMIPLLKKIPKLYNIASKEFKRYDTANTYVDGAPLNAFAIFGSMTQPGFGGFNNPYQQQAMSGMQQPNPMYNAGVNMGYNQQPMMNQPMMNGQPMMNQYTGNPFYQQGMPMNNVQMSAYAPQQQGFAVNERGAATTPAQNTPARTATPVSEGQSSKVDVGLKS